MTRWPSFSSQSLSAKLPTASSRVPSAREDPLADDDEQVAVGVLELEGLAEAERLPVDDEDAVAVLVLDPKVRSDGEDPFLD
jgi:hypothetical protein